jgi:RNA polymerase sigma factor (sigma-70 family)
VRTQISDSVRVCNAPDVELLLLDQALEELGRLDARQLQIVEMRYFGGLSEDEVAAALSLSRRTVARDWKVARAWLSRRMTRGARP